MTMHIAFQNLSTLALRSRFPHVPLSVPLPHSQVNKTNRVPFPFSAGKNKRKAAFFVLTPKDKKDRMRKGQTEIDFYARNVQLTLLGLSSFPSFREQGCLIVSLDLSYLEGSICLSL
jgi:hypothetical protein